MWVRSEKVQVNSHRIIKLFLFVFNCKSIKMLKENCADDVHKWTGVHVNEEEAAMKYF